VSDALDCFHDHGSGGILEGGFEKMSGFNVEVQGCDYLIAKGERLYGESLLEEGGDRAGWGQSGGEGVEEVVFGMNHGGEVDLEDAGKAPRKAIAG